MNNRKTLGTSLYRVFFNRHSFILPLNLKPIARILLMFRRIPIYHFWSHIFFLSPDIPCKVILFLQKFILKCSNTGSIFNKHIWSFLHFGLKLYDFIPGIWLHSIENSGLPFIALSVGRYYPIDFKCPWLLIELLSSLISVFPLWPFSNSALSIQYGADLLVRSWCEFRFICIVSKSLRFLNKSF